MKYFTSFLVAVSVVVLGIFLIGTFIYIGDKSHLYIYNGEEEGELNSYTSEVLSVTTNTINMENGHEIPKSKMESARPKDILSYDYGKDTDFKGIVFEVGEEKESMIVFKNVELIGSTVNQ